MSTRSLRDVRRALDGLDGTAWSLIDSVGRGTWPALAREDDGGLSVWELCRRFSGAGNELAAIDQAIDTAWTHVDRVQVVRQLRARIRNPGLVNQRQTHLCGPASLLFEFARRRPARYVRGIGQLLSRGVFDKPGGGEFVAASDLRARVVPGEIEAADWMFMATLRDAENVTDDVDDGRGIEGITWPYELEEWIEDVLELRADYHPCWFEGEMSALRKGQDAVDAGGVAYLLVDSAIVNDAAGDDEEDVWLRRRDHLDGGFGGWYDRVHCEDDDMLYPNHYVVMRGDLRNTGSESEFNVDLWSFGAQFEITGSGEGFGEYLYAVITGVPR
ncbi:MAG: hypothetical protein J0M09_18785 [Xanthomonadales bacterium]|nr:hypothetical protein [Xanthomonadales bacterium]